MSTNKEMINIALKVHPTTVFHTVFGLSMFNLSRIVVLDAHTLRSSVEYRVGRPISWEEWIDVMAAWCRQYAAVPLALVEGDEEAQLQRAVYRPPVGTMYILMEDI